MKFKADNTHTIVAQSCIPAFQGNGDTWNTVYLPGRWAIMAVLEQNCTVVLPHNPAIRNLVNFLRTLFKQTIAARENIIWTSGKNFLLDTDITTECINEIKELRASLQTRGQQLRVMPYRANTPFWQWANEAGITKTEVVADEESFIERYGHKDILHPYWNASRPSLFSDQQLNIPKGFICQDKAELAAAYTALTRQGITSVVIKPVHSAAGLGIQKAHAAADVAAYEWQIPDQYVIEELLELDRDEHGVERSCSVQFCGDELVGPVTSQILDGSKWVGNVVPAQMDQAFVDSVRAQTRLVLETLAGRGLQGPGGLDFLSAHNQAYLVDPNLGRFTGGHVPQFLAQQLRNDAPWAILDLPCHKSVTEAWEILNRHGLAMDMRTRKGVLPYGHLEGMWSMGFAGADTNIQALQILRQAQELLG